MSSTKITCDGFLTIVYQMYHNYLRPHMSLDGKTPAEACGIKIEVDNNWITLIQNASKIIQLFPPMEILKTIIVIELLWGNLMNNIKLL